MRRPTIFSAPFLFAIFLLQTFNANAGPVETRGTVRPVYRSYQNIPAEYTITPEAFAWKQTLVREEAAYRVYQVTFPSAVTSRHPQNDTVYGEYYLPRGAAAKPVPAILVLHILEDPRFTVERILCRHLAEHGMAAFLMKMPYYGERRVAGRRDLRMISRDFDLTREATRQMVFDARRSVAWLASRPQLDPERLGLAGVSLGAIMGVTVAGVEPRLKCAVLVMAGGGVAEILWNAPETRAVRDECTRRGLSFEDFTQLVHPLEPLRLAGNVRDKKILMINAAFDQTVPRRATDRLWVALDRPPILWYPAGHYAIALFMPSLMKAMTQHFEQGWPK